MYFSNRNKGASILHLHTYMIFMKYLCNIFISVSSDFKSIACYLFQNIDVSPTKKIITWNICILY